MQEKRKHSILFLVENLSVKVVLKIYEDQVNKYHRNDLEKLALKYTDSSWQV